MKAVTNPHIHLSKDNISVQNLNLEDTLLLLGSAFLHILNRAAETTPKDKEILYDSANALFSNILQSFAPEIEMRPDLTVEAILEAENAILDRKVGALEQEAL